MTPIYDASTLSHVSTTARLAEYNRIKNDFVPKALCKINETNFAAANAGFQSATDNFNLLCMGLITEEAQNYFRIGLKTKLESLGFKIDILINANSMMTVTCKW